jgi:16S rRNA (guanine527-N7)-methyltransferase
MSESEFNKENLTQKITAEMESAGLAKFSESAGKLADFYELLIEGSAKTNLIGKINEDRIIKFLFIDSLLFLAHFEPKEGESIIDVGCGAGFPGIVIKIARPDLLLTSLDADGKKSEFLRDACTRLNIEGVDVIHDRAEILGQNPAYREQFNYSLSKALGGMIILVELCSPFVKQGGTLVAWKGGKWKEELDKLGRDYRLLGLMEPVTIKTGLESETTFVCFKKASTCPKRYPSSFQVIKKENLHENKNEKQNRKPMGR